MPRKSPDYSKTIIYKVSCKDPSVSETIYGHTTNISKMKYYYKKHSNPLIDANGGFSNWNLFEIEKFPCAERTDAKIKVNSINN
jgi:hypothetical protein